MPSIGRVGWALCSVGAICLPAWGWTPPLDLTAINGYEVSPRVDSDSNGNIHLVWYGGPDDSSTWDVQYQMYNGSSWSSPFMVASNYCGATDIAVDGSGNLHVVWNQGANPEEIYYRKRTAGVWGTTVNLSNTPSARSLTPRVAVDSTGNHIFVAWQDSDQNGGNWDMLGRKATNGVWAATENISNDSSLSRGANVAIDTLGNFHIVWEDTDTKRAYYRRRNADGSYNTKTAMDPDSAQRSYGPDVAVGPGNVLHFVWHEDIPDQDWDMVYRSLNGSTWSSMINLSNQSGVTDCCGAVGVDSTNQIYVVWHDYNNIYFKRTNGGLWQNWYQISTGTNQTAPVVQLTPTNTSHLLWQQRFDPTPGWDVVWTYRTNPDTSPPGPPTGVSSVPANTTIRVNWTNPGNLDFNGVMVRYKTTGYPTGPTDGTLGCNKLGGRGANDNCTIAGLTNGLTYYIAVFAYDDAANYSSAVQTSAIPALKIDRDRDGDVDMADYGWFQRCLTGSAITQSDPACLDARLDVDTDVDGADSDLFVDCFSGDKLYANSNCIPPVN